MGVEHSKIEEDAHKLVLEVVLDEGPLGVVSYGRIPGEVCAYLQ